MKNGQWRSGQCAAHGARAIWKIVIAFDGLFGLGQNMFVRFMCGMHGSTNSVPKHVLVARARIARYQNGNNKLLSELVWNWNWLNETRIFRVFFSFCWGRFFCWCSSCIYGRGWCFSPPVVIYNVHRINGQKRAEDKWTNAIIKRVDIGIECADSWAVERLKERYNGKQAKDTNSC